ncbi:MAG: hypothetical protein RL722_2823, partial [Pseudomonadota bacterium]
DVREFAASLTQPYCGANAGFEVGAWLEAEGNGPTASLAMIPLRRAPGQAALAGACFGLLVLGSPDPTRYSADMGTDFLARIGETAAAALSRLLPAPLSDAQD